MMKTEEHTNISRLSKKTDKKIQNFLQSTEKRNQQKKPNMRRSYTHKVPKCQIKVMPVHFLNEEIEHEEESYGSSKISNPFCSKR